MSNTGNTANWQRMKNEKEGHTDEPECPSNEKIKTKIIITQGI